MSDQPMTSRQARLQVDADRAAGRPTPHEVLVLAAGDRTVEPILDGRGHPILVDDPEAEGGRRPLSIDEARRGDQWARDTALRDTALRGSHTPDRDDADRDGENRDDADRDDEERER